MMRRFTSARSEEHTSELQSHVNLVCRLLLEKKKRAAGGRAGVCPARFRAACARGEARARIGALTGCTSLGIGYSSPNWCASVSCLSARLEENRAPPDLLSFPTRRSSDLVVARGERVGAEHDAPLPLG